MPKLVYALVCADLIIDRDSSSTSFIRTVEHAVVPSLPAVLPPVFFASLWDLEGNENRPFTVSLRLTPPQGKGTILGVQELTPGATMLHKMNFQLPGLKVAAEGRHTISAAIKTEDGWKTLARLPLFVFKAADKA
ncbi:MAG: hypothetical protein KUA35_01195 [Pseudodesulfovibrio sp.]|uniref:Uncharacterized protein n=1 Tax=Pseudodesulfovibrio aespoeensis (strain ATCC 700646 / DSM 10631 / Aspo-2) TaxID=643562 RepID=E6VV85_PSEA9|nr:MULTISPECIES: hypothetical protein [Pseudodesulfovibrio]MBU4192285.1 hypothetical protein [Pseudomonadota bacterium]ADU61236.1 hypothetical protein Daes_0209 [Pseudodesulfovibrio aespoeensis Aspo-2]MBU4245110.1 hypothetical protein [Pseudomonadota bacterium]MBU4378971.1 hypothetical protein [Pseudomonadota bacterium]MBU4474292.1 hypothetical protein [Pseudomonadota bacterium]